MRPVKRSQAFTLVEVVISIFILSIISVAALASFQQMIRAKEIQKSHEILLTSLSFAYTTLLNDVTQQIDLESPLAFNEREITLTRAWPGGDNELDIATVQYTWQSNSLERQLVRGENITTQTLLKNVRSVQWQWWAENSWNDVSIPLPPDKPLKALKLTFIDNAAGEVSWIFARP